MPFSISFLEPVYLWLLLLLPLFLVLGWPGGDAPGRLRRRLGLGVRLLVFLALVSALSGAQLARPVDVITTVFVIDGSDSVSPAERARAEDFVRAALAAKPDRDRAAVIVFGGDALVERLPNPEKTLLPLSSTPLRQATNIEHALRLALALLPSEGGGRIVLMSDGQQTKGEVRHLLDLAAARQVEVSPMPLAGALGEGPEVLVEQVSAPTQARQGQAVPIEVVVAASQPADVTLRLMADGRLVESRPVRLTAGRNRFSFSVPVEAPGFHRFRVDVEAGVDGRPQNNWGAAFTQVFGPPHVLVVEGTAGEAGNLVNALLAAGMEATVVPPEALPGSLTALAPYDSVVLANVPAAALPEPTQEVLASFVRDLGRGLVMLGGPESYGAGGYLRSPLERALPVDMDIRRRSREPNVALVLAVDKSGSMGACHCDDPDSRLERQARAQSGLPKIDIAKEAIFQASLVLGELDYLGVVAFDNQAHWALETAPLVGPAELERAIGGVPANGQTNIFAGLAAAEEALLAAPARIKHVILLTDGWSSAGAYSDLTARFAEEGITLSVVAAGHGSAEYLQELAEQGGGKYYPAADITDVPQIFLKETVRAAGDYIIEEPFKPVPAVLTPDAGPSGPIVRGLGFQEGASPALLGYNGTTAKAAARVVLLTPRGDPLLATWQYGLGRSVAWTSDLSGRWAQRWLGWDEFPRFAGQLVGWTLPDPGDQRLDVAVGAAGHEVTLTATAQDEQGQANSFLTVEARLVDNNGQAMEVELVPVGPGRYEATAELPAEGVYLAQIVARDGETALPVASRSTGVVMPYSPEYASLAGDLALLSDVAAATGGRLLQDQDVERAFAHTLAAGHNTQALWPGLLLLAALLFPIDVAVRRLRLSRREWQQARTWVDSRLPALRRGPAAGPADTAPPLLGDLFQARQRARHRQAAPPGASPPTPVAPPAFEEASPAPPAAERSPSPPASPAEDEPDTLARLRAAKRRSRR